MKNAGAGATALAAVACVRAPASPVRASETADARRSARRSIGEVEGRGGGRIEASASCPGRLGAFTESSSFGAEQRFPLAPVGNGHDVNVEADVLPDRYRGPRRIGRGGMGEIYRATDEMLGRAVAVKVLTERYAEDEAVRERFTREALAAARLSGRPNIVTIFDVGEHEGRPFIVMEYLGGGSLEERLREGPIAPGQAVAWLRQAAAALDSAHAEGVVHRDVKPANLLLDRDDNLHVADFGIASAAGLDSMTKTGTVIGTAGYLSPEQAQGDRASPASDVYALGVVAWELLTGRRPFEGDTAAAEAAAHVHADVPRISEVRLELPQELDAVFDHALAKDPNARHRSTAELVADLDAALHDSAPATRVLTPAPQRRPPRRSARPSRPSWLVPALVLLALVGAGLILAALVASNDGGGSGGAQETTVVRTVTAQGETQRVTVTASGQTTPAPAPPANAGLSVAEARALQDESTAAMNGGDWERALALSQQALSALRGRDETYEGYANFNIGNSLAHLGRCDEALSYLDRREQLLGPHPAVDEARRICS
jgi:tRNA A-37 threonylcarbamoyl transferase component Bud32